MRTFLAFLLITSTAQAAPILLAELSYQQPEPVTLPAEYTFFTGDQQGALAWTETVSAFPHTSHADAETLSTINRILGVANTVNEYQPPLTLWQAGQWPSTNPPHGPLDCFVCAFRPLMLGEHGTLTPAEVAATMADIGLSAELHVPFIGPRGLMGYRLTDVERIVTADSQTIRFFGEVVPEPASWLIVLCGLVVQWRKRCVAR